MNIGRVFGAGNRIQCKTAPAKGRKTITAHGETHTIKEWAALTGLAYSTIYERYFGKGWPAEKAVGPRAAWWRPKGEQL